MLNSFCDVPGGMCVCNTLDEDAPEESIVTQVSLVDEEAGKGRKGPKRLAVYNLITTEVIDEAFAL